MLINKGFITKTATSFSFLFAVLLLLSLPGESADITSSQEPTLSPSAFSTPTGGFSYNAWRDTGKPVEEEWASGTFILKTPSSDLYRSRLSAAWREAAASALDITPLVREQLLLHANNKKTNTATSLSDYGNAALLNFVDKTTDSLLGGLLDSGRSLNWVKTLDGEFRVQSGKRPWSLGLGGILSLHERQDSAIGLQFFGNSGENNRGYSGLFYRRALGEEHLLGINTFVDYEEDTERNDDGFWRWTLGGEWRTNWADIRANHYLGLTEAKRQSNGAYIYTADGSDIALNLHAPQASWLSGELKYYQWDGQYGDADEQGIKYGVQVSPIGIPGFKFNIGYDNPLDGKGLWEGGFSWTHHFGESASSGGGLRFNAQDNLYESSRSSDTRQRIRESLPQTTQTSFDFTPDALSITLLLPLVTNVLLASVDSYATDGQGSISYVVSSLGSVKLKVAADLSEGSGNFNLFWDSLVLPTPPAGNYAISIVATDADGDKATLSVNVVLAETISFIQDGLSVTLSLQLTSNLLLASVDSLIVGGLGSISYAVSSPNSINVFLREDLGDFNLYWTGLLPTQEGNFVISIVATDTNSDKTTLDINVVLSERLSFALDALSITLSLPLVTNLLLGSVDLLVVGGQGSISYTELSQNSAVDITSSNLYWTPSSTAGANFVIPVVATDEKGVKATLIVHVVALPPLSFSPDALSITLSLPLVTNLLLASVDSYAAGGLRGISYAASSQDSAVDITLVEDTNGTHLNWATLPTITGSFAISVVSTDEGGAKATLNINVVALASLSFTQNALSITLSLPLVTNLLLASVDSYAAGGLRSISYTASSQNSAVDITLVEDTNGTHLNWATLPTITGNFAIPVVATDEGGAKATLNINVVALPPLSFTQNALSITLSLPLVTNLLLAIDSFVAGGRGSISYTELSQNSAVDITSSNLYWTPSSTAGANFVIPVVATDEGGAKATLIINVAALPPLSFSPDALSITLSLPLVTNLLLASVDSYAAGGLRSISYTASSQNSAVDITLVEDTNGTHLNWAALPTITGNFAIPVVATDEGGAKATLNINVVALPPLSFTQNALSITLSLPLVTNLLLAIDSFVAGGRGSISYTELSQNSAVDITSSNLYWTPSSTAGANFVIPVVATDEGGAKATLIIHVMALPPLSFSPDALSITLSLPLVANLLLASVDSYAAGGLRSISYTASSPNSVGVLLVSEQTEGSIGDLNLYWTTFPTVAGNFAIPVVATDEGGAKATLNINVVALAPLSFSPDALSITLSLPLVTNLLLAIDSFVAGGRGSISYTELSQNSAVDITSSNLYWTPSSTAGANFVIPVVATDEGGAKATLIIHVMALPPLSFSPDALSITLSLPLVANLLLASVDSYAAGGLRSISYAASSQDSAVDITLVEDTNGTHLNWATLLTQAGNFAIPVVATDEGGAKATLNINVVALAPLSFSPNALSITLSLPLETSFLLANVDSYAAGGLGNIGYTASSQNSAIGVTLVEDVNNAHFHLYWASLPTITGNFAIPVVATDEGGAKATLNINVVALPPLSFTQNALSITLSLPLVTNLLLAIDSFVAGGRGSISYTELSQNSAVDITSSNLYWTPSSTAGANFAIPVVATDEGGAKATLNINVVALPPLSFTPDALSITLSLPLVTNLLLASVDSYAAGGLRSISYTASSPNSVGVLLVSEQTEGSIGDLNLYWTTFPTVAGNFAIPVVATDEGGAKATLNINVVLAETLSFTQNALSITLSLPLVTNLLLASVDSYAAGGLRGISYAASSQDSAVDITLVEDTNGTHLNWATLLTQAGNFVIPVVATDEGGAKATLNINVVALSPLSLAPDVLNITLLLPLKSYLLLDNLDSFASGGLGSISYAVSSPNPVLDLNLEQYTGGARLWWNVLPTGAGNFVIPVVATDEGGAKATLQINVKTHKNLAVSKALDIITLPLPVRNYFLLSDVGSFFTGGLGNISYAVSGSVLQYRYSRYAIYPSSGVDLVRNANGAHDLWWNRLPNAGHYTYNIVATDEATGSKATLQLVAKVENAILHAVQAIVTVRQSLPINNGLILSDVASLFAGGRGAYDANITYHSDGAAKVLKFPNGGLYNLYWNNFPTSNPALASASEGDIVIDIVATDHANESQPGPVFDINNLNLFFVPLFRGRVPNDTAVTRVIVKLETTSSILESRTVQCSFFSGCPLVNFDGAKPGALGNPGRADWQAINAPLALSLIAAGADVNEVSSVEGDTPLLAIARYGNPAVASVLLAKGADINAVAVVTDPSNNAVYSDIGVLDYVIRNTPTNTAPLVSLFIDYGVDVNHQTRADGVPSITPLDRFNSRSRPAAAAAIKAAGGKCRVHCRTENGITTALDASAVLEMTLSLPLTNYLLLPEVDSFFTGGVGRINYEDFYWAHAWTSDGSTPSYFLIVDFNLEENANGVHLRWKGRLPTQQGSVDIDIIATDEVGSRATLQLKLNLRTVAYTPPQQQRQQQQQCSFFSGCPRVGFDGAKPGALGNPGRADWQAMNAPLALSLIAAGADVNEVSSVEGDTPLLAIARYGNPAVASVLLAKGADINAVAIVTDPSNNAVYSDIGVLDYLIRNTPTNTAPLVSLFIDYGVDVNHQTRADGVPGMTPLDRFNSRSRPAAAAAIKAAGGKCRVHCRTDDVSL